MIKTVAKTLKNPSKALFLPLFVRIRRYRSTPKYINHYVNGKPFEEKKLSHLESLRKRNNPHNENVGKHTSRCHFCGSLEIEILTSRVKNISFKKNCGCCGMYLDGY